MKNKLHVQCMGLEWLGVRTKKFQEMCDFYERVIGLTPQAAEDGFRMYQLPNGERVEVFAQDYKSHQHFTTGPVIGFRVSDIESARATMEAAGIEFLSPIDGERGRSRWSHFRGPDGNVYEITERGS